MSGVSVKIAAGESPVQQFTFGATRALTTTTNQTSNVTYKDNHNASYEAEITGTGAVSATVTIQATNVDAKALGTDTSPWITLGVINLSGTTSDSQGFPTASSWKWVRAVVTLITGTGATVSVFQGV